MTQDLRQIYNLDVSRMTRNPTRRNFLKRLTTLGVMGTAAALRSGDMLASPAGPAMPANMVQRGDENYESWRQSMVWHLDKPARYPDSIIQAHNEQDVMKALAYARAANKRVALRSSGHNSAKSVLRDDGILLDLSFMRNVSIDPARRTANVQPALWNVQLVEEAAKHGLSFPAAHCPSVALGGYLLGGGMGWNHAHWGGPACHSIVSMDVITADGKKVRASASENPDLYWAARGAGPGFFGVVTNFELKLYSAPAHILNSMYIHPLDNLPAVSAALEKLVEIKDERVELLLLLMHNPQAPAGTPPAQSKICFVGANAFADSEEEAKEMLLPFAESELAAQSVFKAEYQPSSFNKLYYPENVDTGLGRYAVDTDWSNDLGGLLGSVAEHFRETPSERSHFVGSLAMNTTLHDDACFSRIARHFFGSYLVWDREEDDEANYAWLEKNHELVKPYSEGHYVNEVAGDRFPGRYRDSFSPENWQRLGDLRRKYDPTGVFHAYLGES